MKKKTITLKILRTGAFKTSHHSNDGCAMGRQLGRPIKLPTKKTDAKKGQ